MEAAAAKTAVIIPTSNVWETTFTGITPAECNRTWRNTVLTDALTIPAQTIITTMEIAHATPTNFAWAAAFIGMTPAEISRNYSKIAEVPA